MQRMAANCGTRMAPWRERACSQTCCQALASAFPGDIHALGSGFLFTALDAGARRELWYSDGTSGGTRRLLAASRLVLPGDPAQRWFQPLGARILFAGDDGMHGVEPWGTDGTAQGTQMLADTAPGAVGGLQLTPRPARSAASGRVWFLATSAAHGSEPWITDGTPAGTFLLQDVHPGTGGSAITYLTPFGRCVLMDPHTPAHGREPWVSDGTSGGTKLLLELAPGPASGLVRPSAAIGTPNGHAWFTACTDIETNQVWTTDGTHAGTHRRHDFRVRMYGAQRTPTLHVLGEGLLLFPLTDAAGHEPWSGGRTTPFAQLRDIRAGGEWSVDGLHQHAISAGNRLLFLADDGAHGIELWTTDGTSDGTVLLQDLARRRNGSWPEPFARLRDRVVFLADDGVHGRELWVSNGATAGTQMLGDLTPGSAPSRLDAARVLEARDRLFFAHDDGVHGSEPWVTDGTPAGTARIADVNPGGTSLAVPLGAAGGRMLYRASDGQRGEELWSAGGTPGDFELVADIHRGLLQGSRPGEGAPLLAAEVGTQLVFTADDGIHGRELWASDGTAAGTTLLADIEPGAASAFPVLWNQFAVVGGRTPWMLFAAHTVQTGWEPWITDGTASGTRILRDLVAGPGSSMEPGRSWCEAVGSGVCLQIAVGTAFELWFTDGTLPGTTRLAGSASAFGVPGRTNTMRVADGFLFVMRDLLHGREPWFSDGSFAGTRLLADLAPGAASSEPHGFTRAGDQVLFVADDGVHGFEPWLTDGTSGGTRFLRDLEPGRASSMGPDPAMSPPIAAVGDSGHALLLAWTSLHGEEAWLTDGTAAGTRLLADLEPGPEGSRPAAIGRAGNALLLAAWTGRSGRELHALDLRDAGAAVAAEFGTGCAGGSGIPRLHALGLPRLGLRFEGVITHARPLAPAVLLIGRGPEPSFFAGGCSFYLQPLPADLRTVITDPLGEARVPLQVPPDPRLVGLLLHAQALVLDPHGAWLGLLAFSNGLELVIGR